MRIGLPCMFPIKSWRHGSLLTSLICALDCLACFRLNHEGTGYCWLLWYAHWISIACFRLNHEGTGYCWLLWYAHWIASHVYASFMEARVIADFSDMRIGFPSMFPIKSWRHGLLLTSLICALDFLACFRLNHEGTSHCWLLWYAHWIALRVYASFMKARVIADFSDMRIGLPCVFPIKSWRHGSLLTSLICALDCLACLRFIHEGTGHCWLLWSSFVCSLNPIRQTFIPQPLIPLLYNPFTMVLLKSLWAYLFRAAYTPACWIGTKRNKDFHPAMPQPIGNQDYCPNPSRMWIQNKKEGNWLFCKEVKLKVKSKLKNFVLCF